VEYQFEILSNSRLSASVEASFSGLALLTVGNGGKGTLPWRFAGTRVSVNPGISASFVLDTLGDSGQAMRGSSVTDAPAAAGNAGPRKNTWWCNPLNQHRQS